MKSFGFHLKSLWNLTKNIFVKLGRHSSINGAELRRRLPTKGDLFRDGVDCRRECGNDKRAPCLVLSLRVSAILNVYHAWSKKFILKIGFHTKLKTTDYETSDYQMMFQLSNDSFTLFYFDAATSLW